MRGAATRLDVVRIRQDVAVAKSALIAGDEQLRRTREAPGLAIGQDAEVGLAAGFSLDTMVLKVTDRCRPLDDEEQRADLVAAREQASAAHASRWQAVAGYLPTLGVSSSASALTTTPGPVRVPTRSIAAVISVPLWEGGFREGLVSERHALETQAELDAEAVRRAAVERERAERAEGAAHALLSTAQEGRELADRLDYMTRRSFEIGRATSVDLVQSAVALRQAELNLALREFDWVQARVDSFLTVATCAP